MDTLRAELLCKTKMREHGLDGWAFSWSNGARRYGYCNYYRRVISLSKAYVKINEEHEVLDTIMHEIAHALVGPGHGHDWLWKQMARKLGAKPRATTSTAKSVKGKYIAECPNCGIKIQRHRRTESACKRCCERLNGGQYSPSFKFVFYEAEEEAA